MKYIVMSVMLVLFSCGVKNTTNTTNTAKSSEKITGSWCLFTMNGKEVSFDNKSTVLSLKIDEKGFSGFDSCNNFFGKFKKITNKEIEFGTTGSTMMACYEQTFNVQLYYELLSKVKYYKLEKGQLKLLDKDNKELLQYNRL
ncbi:MAG: META domain-containing protein [Tenacibaculum sp.]|nr:META domain-containing protein [Tenacibaculum sp.]